MTLLESNICKFTLSCFVCYLGVMGWPQDVSESTGTVLTSGVVTDIIDGDTFKYCPTEYDPCTDDQLIEVDLWGVDAPEITPEEQFFAKKASQYLADELRGQTVILEQIRVLDNGKPKVKTMIVNHPHSNFNVHLLLEGHGWAATTEEDNQVDVRAYQEAETFARERRLGLWREIEPIAPWDWLIQHSEDLDEEAESPADIDASEAEQ